METLGTALPKEQARVRALISEYLAIGPDGSFAATIMENALRRTDMAVSSGDVVAMLRCYEELKGFTG